MLSTLRSNPWPLAAAAVPCALLGGIVVRDYLRARRAIANSNSRIHFPNCNPPLQRAMHVPAVLLWYTFRYTIGASLLLGARICGANLLVWLGRRLMLKQDAEIKSRVIEPFVASVENGERTVDNTVWIVTEAKAGTNLTMMLAELVLLRGDIGPLRAVGHIHERIPWPDSPFYLNDRDYAIRYNDSVPPVPPSKLTIVKTHMQLEQLRWRQTVPNQKGKYICVVRNPKDIIVSLYHFAAQVALGPANPPLDVMLELVCDTKSENAGLWPERIAYEWKHRNDRDVLFLFYEDIVQNKRDAVVQVAGFMGFELTEEEIRNVVEYTSFGFMKQNTYLVDAGCGSALAYGGSMVRSGKTDGAKNSLTLEQRLYVDKVMMERLAAVGSDFPYKERYAEKSKEN